MLLKVLIRQVEGLVRLPDDATINAYTQAMQARHRSLDNVFCTADGLKLPFQQCSGLSGQSMFHNGLLHGHYITIIFSLLLAQNVNDYNEFKTARSPLFFLVEQPIQRHFSLVQEAQVVEVNKIFCMEQEIERQQQQQHRAY
jgi:hypothetical protein